MINDIVKYANEQEKERLLALVCLALKKELNEVEEVTYNYVNDELEFNFMLKNRTLTTKVTGDFRQDLPYIKQLIGGYNE